MGSSQATWGPLALGLMVGVDGPGCKEGAAGRNWAQVGGEENTQVTHPASCHLQVSATPHHGISFPPQLRAQRACLGRNHISICPLGPGFEWELL